MWPRMLIEERRRDRARRARWEQTEPRSRVNKPRERPSLTIRGRYVGESMEGATLHRNQQTKTVFKGKDEKLREQRWRTLSRQKQSPHEEPTPFPHRLAAAKAVRRLQEGSVERERREVLTVCKQPLFPSSQRALEASLAPHASFAEMVISWDLKSDCCV